MARPTKPEKDKLDSMQIRVPKSLKARLQKVADDQGLSRAQVMRLSTEAGLKAMERMSKGELADYISRKVK